MSAFSNIAVTPNHGSRSCMVSWELDTEYEQSPVYVAFSKSGVKGSWKVLNPDDPVIGLGVYAYNDYHINDRDRKGFYRLMVVAPDSTQIGSDIIEPARFLTNKEYGIIHKIMKMELQQMRAADGILVCHCIPKDFGKLSKIIREDTGMSNGFEDSTTPVEERSFGERYQGGYFQPMLTWMTIKSTQSANPKDSGSVGADDQVSAKVRMLSFPRPRVGHLLIDPRTDERYVVETVDPPAMLRSIAPVAFNATLRKLHPRDQRFGFPIPEIVMDEYRAAKNIPK